MAGAGAASNPCGSKRKRQPNAGQHTTQQQPKQLSGSKRKEGPNAGEHIGQQPKRSQRREGPSADEHTTQQQPMQLRRGKRDRPPDDACDGASKELKHGPDAHRRLRGKAGQLARIFSSEPAMEDKQHMMQILANRRDMAGVAEGAGLVPTKDQEGAAELLASARNFLAMMPAQRGGQHTAAHQARGTVLQALAGCSNKQRRLGARKSRLLGVSDKQLAAAAVQREDRIEAALAEEHAVLWGFPPRKQLEGERTVKPEEQQRIRRYWEDNSKVSTRFKDVHHYYFQLRLRQV